MSKATTTAYLGQEAQAPKTRQTQRPVLPRLGLILAAPVLASVALLGCGGPEYPNCDDDKDCKEAEFCVNGQCQQCRDANDCPQGQTCAGGRCDPIPGYCEGTGDCPSGQECENNRCVSVVQSAAPPSGPTECSFSAVYFAFDSESLDGTAREAISANASCLQEKGLSSVHLTGHTDPRGTEEYNLALGDRRARSVKDYIKSLGVAAQSISSSSVGEEMAQGSDESSWGRDRRVDVQPK